MNLKKIKLSSLFIILNIFVLFTSVLFIEEIYKLQFSDSEYFKNQALSNRQKIDIIEAKRGSILDREFNEVSETINAFNIGIYPEQIDDKELVSELLAPLLQLDKVTIFERLKNNKNYFYLNRNVDFDIGSKINSQDPLLTVHAATKEDVDIIRNEILKCFNIIADSKIESSTIYEIVD